MTAVNVILHLDDHSTFGAESGLPDTALGINADTDKYAGNGYVCFDCFVAIGGGCRAHCDDLLISPARQRDLEINALALAAQ